MKKRDVWSSPYHLESCTLSEELVAPLLWDTGHRNEFPTSGRWFRAPDIVGRYLWDGGLSLRNLRGHPRGSNSLLVHWRQYSLLAYGMGQNTTIYLLGLNNTCKDLKQYPAHSKHYKFLLFCSLMHSVDIYAKTVLSTWHALFYVISTATFWKSTVPFCREIGFLCQCWGWDLCS